MSRSESVSLALSRCTLSHVVVTWSGGRNGLRPTNEDPECCAREEARVTAHLRALTPAFEVVLDELESRVASLQRAPIAGVAEIVIGGPVLGFARGQSAFSLRASCVDRARGLIAMRQLTERFAALLTPTPRPTKEDFLDAFERFTKRQRTEPRHLQLARWLELAPRVSSQSPRRPCAVCGATAVEVEDTWVDNDWHASHRDSLDTICLEAPHVVTLSES